MLGIFLGYVLRGGRLGAYAYIASRLALMDDNGVGWGMMGVFLSTVVRVAHGDGRGLIHVLCAIGLVLFREESCVGRLRLVLEMRRCGNAKGTGGL